MRSFVATRPANKTRATPQSPRSGSRYARTSLLARPAQETGTPAEPRAMVSIRSFVATRPANKTHATPNGPRYVVDTLVPRYSTGGHRTPPHTRRTQTMGLDALMPRCAQHHKAKGWAPTPEPRYSSGGRGRRAHPQSPREMVSIRSFVATRPAATGPPTHQRGPRSVSIRSKLATRPATQTRGTPTEPRNRARHAPSSLLDRRTERGAMHRNPRQGLARIATHRRARPHTRCATEPRRNAPRQKQPNRFT